MVDKFFAYDPDAGYETFKTAEEAKEFAEQAISDYRENAHEGWAEEVDGVCWGEIKQAAAQIGSGHKVEFEGELVESVDYQLADL